MTMDNPFRPPDAVLGTSPSFGAPGTLIAEGRTLPAAHGWQWVRGSVSTIARAPLQWVGIALLFVGLTIAISLVPIVSLFSSVMMPILIGGLMLGCRADELGRQIAVRDLFGACQAPHLQPLAMVGVLYLAASILLIMCIGIVAAVGIGVAAVFGGAEAIESQPLLLAAGIAIAVLLVVGVSVALSMTIWFAPALVVLHGLQPMDAMRTSLRGALRNMLPFLVYGLAVLGMALATACVAGGFMMIAGMTLGSSEFGIPAAAIGAAVTGALVMVLMVPTYWAAMYVSYRDVFVG